eukprot:6214591-Pleurochrysis_carterae.AAC.2
MAARNSKSELVARSQIRNGYDDSIRLRNNQGQNTKINQMRRSMAGVESSIKAVGGINCQVGHTGGRPTCRDSPNAKNITPNVLSHTLAK